MNQFFLSKKTTYFYKGLSILMILAHNFFHWLPPKIGEHEMGYSIVATNNFFSAIYSHPSKILHILISYLGWIAISLFVFLSAYGLSQKYLQSNKKSFFKLVLYQIKKVYILYLIGVLTFIIFYVLIKKTIPWYEILRCLSLTNNLIPKDVFLLNGPWWFFSLIIQLYLIFPILFNFISKQYKRFFQLVFLYFIFVYVLTFIFGIKTTYLYANFLGHIPEFSLGIFLSLYPKIKLNINSIFLVTFFIFIMSSISTFFHPFIFLTGTIVLLFFYDFINKISYSCRLICLMGIISPYLFIVHGYLRAFFMELMITNKNDGYETSISFFIWFITCVLISLFLKFITSVFYLFKQKLRQNISV